VIKKLDGEVDKKAVICLQEVSTKWAGSLHTYFAEKSYHMMHVGYGNRFDGYMGVALAFPLDTYRLCTARIERVSDLKSWVSPPKPGLLARIWRGLRDRARRWRGIKPPVDAYTDAMRRHNQLLMARLEDRASGARFVVGTYHMPCQFRVPQVGGETEWSWSNDRSNHWSNHRSNHWSN
jgi:2',5'-phosphodiesterase